MRFVYRLKQPLAARRVQQAISAELNGSYTVEVTRRELIVTFMHNINVNEKKILDRIVNRLLRTTGDWRALILAARELDRGKPAVCVTAQLKVLAQMLNAITEE